MRGQQRGVSLMGLLVVCVILIVCALIGLKVAPPYLEYLQIKKAAAAVAIEGGATVGDVKKAFDRRAQVDDISSITSEDLEISKEGSDVVVSFAYSKKVPLFGQVSLMFDFAGSSKGR